MFLSFVPGIFTDWNHPREIVYLTSRDGVKWDTVGPVDLKSDRVIDACIIRLADGTWRMWYKDERRPKALCYADSRRPQTWEPKGNAVTDLNGEGPKVIHWKGRYWLIADCWTNGMRVWSSDDCLKWKLQDEALFGSHGDVVVSGGRVVVLLRRPSPSLRRLHRHGVVARPRSTSSNSPLRTASFSPPIPNSPRPLT